MRDLARWVLAGIVVAVLVPQPAPVRRRPREEELAERAAALVAELADLDAELRGTRGLCLCTHCADTRAGRRP